MTRTERQVVTWRRPGPGFTLAEVLVCVLVLALAMGALVVAFGREAVVAQRAEELTLASFLADEIRDMARYRSFDTVFDLDGAAYSPPVLSTGVEQGLSEYTQEVAVTPLSRDDLQQAVTPEDAGAARVDVAVKTRGTIVLSRTYYVMDMEGVQTE